MKIKLKEHIDLYDLYELRARCHSINEDMFDFLKAYYGEDVPYVYFTAEQVSPLYYRISIEENNLQKMIDCGKTDFLILPKAIFEEYEKILDKKEKEYLSAVIRPFRDRIKYIKKCIASIGETITYISICVHDESSPCNEYIHLPYFEQDTMYKDMELEKEYTLEELGLLS